MAEGGIVPTYTLEEYVAREKQRLGVGVFEKMSSKDRTEYMRTWEADWNAKVAQERAIIRIAERGGQIDDDDDSVNVSNLFRGIPRSPGNYNAPPRTANQGNTITILGEQVVPQLKTIVGPVSKPATKAEIEKMMADPPTTSNSVRKNYTIPEADTMSQGGELFDIATWYAILNEVLFYNTADEKRRKGLMREMFYQAKYLKQEHQGGHIEVTIGIDDNVRANLNDLGANLTGNSVQLKITFPKGNEPVGTRVLTCDRFKAAAINYYVYLCSQESAAGALADSCGYGTMVNYFKIVDSITNGMAQLANETQAAMRARIGDIISAEGRLGDKSKAYSICGIIRSLKLKTVDYMGSGPKPAWDITALIGGSCSLKEFSTEFIKDHPSVLLWTFVYAMMTDARSSELAKRTTTATAKAYERRYVDDLNKRYVNRGIKIQDMVGFWKLYGAAFSAFVSYTGELSAANVELANYVIDNMEDNKRTVAAMTEPNIVFAADI